MAVGRARRLAAAGWSRALVRAGVLSLYLPARAAGRPDFRNRCHDRRLHGKLDFCGRAFSCTPGQAARSQSKHSQAHALAHTLCSSWLVLAVLQDAKHTAQGFLHHATLLALLPSPLRTDALQALQKAVKQMAARAGTEALTHNIKNEGLKARACWGAGWTGGHALLCAARQPSVPRK